jgi:hypothetical protein
MLPCIRDVLPPEIYFSEQGYLPLVPRNTPGYPGNGGVMSVMYVVGSDRELR